MSKIHKDARDLEKKPALKFKRKFQINKYLMNSIFTYFILVFYINRNKVTQFYVSFQKLHIKKVTFTVDESLF